MAEGKELRKEVARAAFMAEYAKVGGDGEPAKRIMTVDEIQAVMKIGSDTTAGNYRREFLSEARANDVLEAEVPKELWDHLRATFTQVYLQVTEVAERKALEIVAEETKKKTAAENQGGFLASENDRLVLENERLKGDLAASNAELRALSEARLALVDKCARLEAKLAETGGESAMANLAAKLERLLDGKAKPAVSTSATTGAMSAKAASKKPTAAPRAKAG